jgi:peptide-methionine (R)-S-oxide reductase
MFRYRNQIGSGKRVDRDQIYTCSKCGTALFNTAAKFTVGSGFPSFWEHIGENVRQKLLQTYGRERIQLLCDHCGQHLGHLFDDSRTPTHKRYCINENAIEIKKL